MRGIKDQRNGTESIMKTTQSSNAVQQLNTSSELTPSLIASTPTQTNEFLRETNNNISGGGTLLARAPLSPPFYSLIHSQRIGSSQTSNSFSDHQEYSVLTVPSVLSMSTNVTSSSSSTRSVTQSSSPATVQLSLSNNVFVSRSSVNAYRPVSNQSPPPPDISLLTSRSRSRDEVTFSSPPVSPLTKRGRPHKQQHNISKEKRKEIEEANRRRAICNELGKNARKENDAMVYLDGPRIYTCGECRTHLTSHDEIISKSFHGRHGRAYLFDQCVNVITGPAEDRRLITGLHSVCDISCKRCKTLIGWTYAKAYEQSQKYKEGKFIIEKIHLHMEESDCYNINLPAGEKRDRWRIRSMSWSSDHSLCTSPRSRGGHTIYEYRASSSNSMASPKLRSSSISTAGGVSSLGSPPLLPALARPPSPSDL